eukprot:TRINITY_DN10693_c0_g1_i1.p1 TRINITY_DN10693_c0_g1~~TRINITY_DN10693_c0_g1_i1.p1  ORF type:complete len:296 (+),score=95.04 TRINITY_DN10693_c0_g1_i1:132-890(+)
MDMFNKLKKKNSNLKEAAAAQGSSSSAQASKKKEKKTKRGGGAAGFVIGAPVLTKDADSGLATHSPMRKIALHVLIKDKMYEELKKRDFTKEEVDKRNEEDMTPIIALCQEADPPSDVIQHLLKFKPDVNASQGEWRWSALHLLCHKCPWNPAVEMLAKNGADVNAGGFKNYTPLHLFARHVITPERAEQYKKNMKALMVTGNINAVTVDGETPTQNALVNGNLLPFTLCLEYNPDLSISTKNGFTLLHQAI